MRSSEALNVCATVWMHGTQLKHIFKVNNCTKRIVWISHLKESHSNIFKTHEIKAALNFAAVRRSPGVHAKKIKTGRTTFRRLHDKNNSFDSNCTKDQRMRVIDLQARRSAEALLVLTSCEESQRGDPFISPEFLKLLLLLFSFLFFLLSVVLLSTWWITNRFWCLRKFTLTFNK